jgi:hypothetical protein
MGTLPQDLRQVAEISEAEREKHQKLEQVREFGAFHQKK